MKKKKLDVEAHGFGSIVGLVGKSHKGNQFLREKLASESWQWQGAMLCVDHRMAEDAIQHVRDNGLVVANAK